MKRNNRYKESVHKSIELYQDTKRSKEYGHPRKESLRTRFLQLIKRKFKSILIILAISPQRKNRYSTTIG